MSFPDNEELKAFQVVVEGQQSSVGPYNSDCQCSQDTMSGGISERTHLQFESAFARQTRPTSTVATANGK